MSKMPVAGVVWQTLHYLLGFERLGFEAYYVEEHARTPSMFMVRSEDDGWARAAGFLAGVMDRFGLSGRWAYHAIDRDDRHFGLSDAKLKSLYASAELLINLHGGTLPLPEHVRTGRLIYLETDPVGVQIELHNGVSQTVEFLDQHIAHFSFGENYGRPDCGVPVSDRFTFRPTRQPVILDLWASHARRGGELFTTIGNWQQAWGDIRFDGEVYRWSKHHEFLKFVDLPGYTAQRFELALSSCSPTERKLLEEHGWSVRDAMEFSPDLDAYRSYIGASRGEFTVAKDQNVRLRSGWFSDRSVTYLAMGKPVITQETGFSNVLPTGEGLFAATDMESVVAAVATINGGYGAHSQAARDIAHNYFSHEVVLRQLLNELGVVVQRKQEATRSEPIDRVPHYLDLVPVSRCPTTLREESVEAMLQLPDVPALPHQGGSTPASPAVSIIVLSYNTMPFTKLCVTSLLANTGHPNFDLIVVDNGSTDGSADYLGRLGDAAPRVRVILNEHNGGFAAGMNQGLDAAKGRFLVLLNNDTVLPPGWLAPLVETLGDPGIGLVGPTTNRCGNEARVVASYRTYGDMLGFAKERACSNRGSVFDITTLNMFCVGTRQDVVDRVGRLDARYGIGLFEDDDYAMRVRQAGYRVVCAEASFVHHFGEASMGRLVSTGEFKTLFERNRRLFEERWGPWAQSTQRTEAGYARMVDAIRNMVAGAVPPGAAVAVVSRGDDELLRLGGCEAWHFPQVEDGTYAGHYPADSEEAIAQLEALRARGAQYLVIPATSSWWLGHYDGLARYLERNASTAVRDPDTCDIFALRNPGKSHGDGSEDRERQAQAIQKPASQGHGPSAERRLVS